jgi:uncharacterized membrane protein YkoI
MPVSPRLPFLVLIGLMAYPAQAADMQRHACLTKAEQRAAVASHTAIPLAKALKAPRAHGRHAEVVRARLCRDGDKLVYVLTLLGRSGKVTTATVDAASGEPVSAR